MIVYRIWRGLSDAARVLSRALMSVSNWSGTRAYFRYQKVRRD